MTEVEDGGLGCLRGLLPFSQGMDGIDHRWTDSAVHARVAGAPMGPGSCCAPRPPAPRPSPGLTPPAVDGFRPPAPYPFPVYGSISMHPRLARNKPCSSDPRRPWHRPRGPADRVRLGKVHPPPGSKRRPLQVDSYSEIRQISQATGWRPRCDFSDWRRVLPLWDS